jgi:hypothetical protein
MARKARRKKQTVLTQSQLVGTKQSEAAAAGKVVVKAHKSGTSRKATVNFREEYRYVIADLNRIGLLAALMFAVLIALNLLLK